MNIVYALTSNFVELARPSMRSLLEHNQKAKIYLLTDGEVKSDIPMTVIDISDRHEFDGSVNIRNNFGGVINLLKVEYADILKVNKVIHLDADTIICDSLEPMWKADLTGKWVAAVQEYRGSYRPFGDRYYNMGVAVINLAQMRKDKIIPEMVEYLNTVKQPYVDQDAWHKFGMDKFVDLPVRYNESTVTDKTDDPAIVHFCGYPHWYNDWRMPRKEYLEKYR